jgi:hypothetical protein
MMCGKSETTIQGEMLPCEANGLAENGPKCEMDPLIPATCLSGGAGGVERLR